jgi:tRNA pseudouridine38-40 synthase
VKLKLTIAYDGAPYAGWQAQKTGLGVQQRVEEAVAKIFPNAGRLHSSSRTDTGVHALGMVAHVEIPNSEFKMSPSKAALAINAHLPREIRIMAACALPRGF